MFDGMDASEACGDMFEYGVNDDHLKLIHEANNEVVINVKTPQGLSNEYTLTNKVMQGDTWAPALASAQVDAFGKEMLEEQPSFMFRFLGEVAIPLLGQVDDLIGVAEAGYKSDQLNAFVNAKTADKDLQFGHNKCKTMLISKGKHQSYHKPKLTVDPWELNHEEDGNIREEFKGKVPIEEENSLMYLGYMLSNKGSNMENITHKRNKVIGTQKQILKLIEPLGPYTFESAFIYIQSLIRNSILYGAEAMYIVKETDYRALEMIEESVMKKVFQTKKTCPRHLLYLEAGVVPARYQVERQILNFLKYILQQDQNSMICRMFWAMKENPTRGDWASFAISLIQKYNLNLSLTDIKNMKTNLFKKLVKKQMKEIALSELIFRQKKGAKGKFIHYNSFNMAEYLLPESNLTVIEKVQIFALRTEMNDNPCNFGEKIQCQLGCSQVQDNEHILNCPVLEESENILNLEDLRNGPIHKKIEIIRKFNKNSIRIKEHLRDSVHTVNPL
jgi:hypothetical protein